MKTFTRYLAIITIFLMSFVFTNENRINVGSRKLTEYEEKELIEQEKKELLSLNYNNQYPPLIYDHYTHNLVGVSVLGDYLIIEDGSQWNIKYNFSKEVFFWKENDPILIIKNNSFFSSYFGGYRYKMINARTNTEIEVKLHLGPILDNPYTLQIAAINPTTNEIILSDNSLWKCDPSQRKLLSKWIASDCIIIGSNPKGWFGGFYENILINVNMLQEIKANRLE